MKNLVLIKDGIAIIQCNGLVYTDTIENFILDGGEAMPEGVRQFEYKQNVEAIVDGVRVDSFKVYGERLLALLPVLCESFEKRKKVREEVERAERETEEQKRREREEAERLANMTEEEKATHELEQAKSDRAEAVSKITVEVDGMIFDGDEESQQRVARSIIALENGETMPWVLYDNTIAEVNKEQLKRVLRLAGQKQSELWVVPYTSA